MSTKTPEQGPFSGVDQERIDAYYDELLERGFRPGGIYIYLEGKPSSALDGYHAERFAGLSHKLEQLESGYMVVMPLPSSAETVYEEYGRDKHRLVMRHLTPEEAWHIEKVRSGLPVSPGEAIRSQKSGR